MIDTAPQIPTLYGSARYGPGTLVTIADMLHERRQVARRIWPDIDSDAAEHVCIFMTRAHRDGLNVDISAFAALLGRPRSSTHRMLQRWRDLGYCDLRPHGRRTLVFGTPKMVSKSQEYLEAIASLTVRTWPAVVPAE